jgi:hypothetical protein
MPLGFLIAKHAWGKNTCTNNRFCRKIWATDTADGNMILKRILKYKQKIGNYNHTDRNEEELTC